MRSWLALTLVGISMSLIAVQPASGAALGAFGWGDNEAGQLGDGTTMGSDLPVTVSGLKGVVAVSGGADFSVALISNGTVMAWGYNAFGQLGDGLESSSDVPVAMSELSEVVAVAAGYNHSMALLLILVQPALRTSQSTPLHPSQPFHRRAPPAEPST